MNERIKELAEIARRKPMGNSWTYAHFDEFEQRFAELIVRECADIASINQYQPYTAGHYVLKHFGVSSE